MTARALDFTVPYVRPTWGNANAPIVVVCDAATPEAYEQGRALALKYHQHFALVAKEFGFSRNDFLFVGLCPPVPKQDVRSASRRWAHVEPYVDGVREIIARHDPRMVVTFGELATRAVLGRAVKITKVRGVAVVREDGPPVFPMLSPGFVAKVPDHVSTFRADVSTLSRIRNAEWDVAAISTVESDYQWCTDISAYLGENRPSVITLDTETANRRPGGNALRWWDPDTYVLTVQFSTGPGHAVVCPVDPAYWGKFKRGERNRLVRQLKELLEDPRVRKIGQNIKYDHLISRCLGIEVQGWLHDTMLMAFAVDENMMSLGQDELTRVYAPEMSGYADEFNRKYDKALMHLVPHDDMLTYAGGDPDACFRIARSLQPRLAKDSRQQNIYRRIQLPAVLSFANMTEPYGLLVDKDKLREFCNAVESWLDEEYGALIRLVPPAVRRKHFNSGKDLVFSRPDFVRDVLFSRGGFGLAPVAYTDSTKDLEDKSLRVPSTSTKHHMPYFVNDPRTIGDTDVTVGDFVTRLIEFQKTTKMSSTYLGHEATEEEDASGIWQYMSPGGRVHPSYGVSFTATGRTNSRDPNGQNFPKRGSRWAKLYQQIFIPTPGYKFVAADLSQVELRVAAEMAQEQTMLRIFREGGDIHVMTAAFVLGLAYEQVAAWKGSETSLLDVANDVPGSGDFLRKLNPGARSEATVGDYFKQKRFEAKAIAFGFLFGMGWRKFRVYAKTEYGLDYTEEEAQALRTAFFARYPGLVLWHETMKEFAWQHGYVRALHGACRHLPSVYSEDEAIAAAAGRYAVNSPVQRLGSDLGLIAKIRFSHQVDPEVIRDLAFVHDQLILEVKEGHEEEAGKALKWCMENPPLEEWFGLTMSVPIIAEVEIGDNGGSLVEQDGMEAAKPDWWDDDEEAAAARFYARRRPAGEAVRLAA